MRGRMQARPAARREQRVGERRGGALGRHIDRRVGERERAVRAGKAVDQRAVEQRAAERRQKRRAGGNREDARLAQGPCRFLGGPCWKASGGASSFAGPGETPVDGRSPQPPSAASSRSNADFAHGNSESQPVGRIGEGAGQNPRAEQALEAFARLGVGREAEEARSADHAPAAPLEQRVEPRASAARRAAVASSQADRRAPARRSRSPGR